MILCLDCHCLRDCQRIDKIYKVLLLDERVSYPKIDWPNKKNFHIFLVLVWVHFESFGSPDPTSTPVISSCMTLAELMTPGNPAPGCVPAPTK